MTDISSYRLGHYLAELRVRCTEAYEIIVGPPGFRHMAFARPYLDVLPVLRQQARDLECAEACAVAGAPAKGATLGEVARALGVSRQSVHQRYAHLRPEQLHLEVDASGGVDATGASGRRHEGLR